VRQLPRFAGLYHTDCHRTAARSSQSTCRLSCGWAGSSSLQEKSRGGTPCFACHRTGAADRTWCETPNPCCCLPRSAFRSRPPHAFCGQSEVRASTRSAARGTTSEPCFEATPAQWVSDTPFLLPNIPQHTHTHTHIQENIPATTRKRIHKKRPRNNRTREQAAGSQLCDNQLHTCWTVAVRLWLQIASTMGVCMGRFVVPVDAGASHPLCWLAARVKLVKAGSHLVVTHAGIGTTALQHTTLVANLVLRARSTHTPHTHCTTHGVHHCGKCTSSTVGNTGAENVVSSSRARTAQISRHSVAIEARVYTTPHARQHTTTTMCLITTHSSLHCLCSGRAGHTSQLVVHDRHNPKPLCENSARLLGICNETTILHGAGPQLGQRKFALTRTPNTDTDCPPCDGVWEPVVVLHVFVFPTCGSAACVVCSRRA